MLLKFTANLFFFFSITTKESVFFLQDLPVMISPTKIVPLVVESGTTSTPVSVTSVNPEVQNSQASTQVKD